MEMFESADGVLYSSWISAAMKPAVETLFFFNPQQEPLRARIRDTVVRTGTPYLVEESGRIRLTVASGRMQCLFACSARKRLAGIALYDRPEKNRLRICHLVVDPDQGGDSGVPSGLATAIIEKVRQIGLAISGIELIELPYRRNRCLPISKSVLGRMERCASARSQHPETSDL